MTATPTDPPTCGVTIRHRCNLPPSHNAIASPAPALNHQCECGYQWPNDHPQSPTDNPSEPDTTPTPIHDDQHIQSRLDAVVTLLGDILEVLRTSADAWTTAVQHLATSVDWVDITDQVISAETHPGPPTEEAP